MNDQIAMMLEALLIQNKQVQWIGGYVPGLTSKGDPYISLFNPHAGMVNKVVKVYENSFGKLPDFINTEIPDRVHPSKNTMDKGAAISAGLYVKVPSFKILTYDGKMTQMGPEKRFFNVFWAPSVEYENGDPVGARAIGFYMDYLEENEGKRPFS